MDSLYFNKCLKMLVRWARMVEGGRNIGKCREHALMRVVVMVLFWALARRLELLRAAPEP